ncbi:N-acetylglucosamine kinase [Rhizobium sp. CFBP 8762]|uniref:BadF/BadG/BcrA/BcrD ATPase family protein n=1 Tax=Rhizobium sp. CFBP 8762 TaxID=2775279 RepID=UPI0017819FD8|nr:BadF/BadG/BcrA/BcrD ATPase family protein [Rhizobium sp. CFBP 8762]MBD8554100.1 N-acetylglucosamine kinase [Rhizobium sp. CFBP 8762]
MVDLILGIDGGGTSCRAAVAGADGIIGRGKSGASNILTDPDTALIHIEAAARAALEDAGLDGDAIHRAKVLLGVAGSNAGAATRYVLDRLPFAQSAIESDGLIALQGALGDEDGAVAILGTGSIFIVRRGGTVRYFGGWGFVIGDLGSGAWLGRAVLQEMLLAYDAVHTASALTDAILTRFDGDPRAAVEFARTARPNDFARFAPLVFEYAEQGDAVGVALLKAAAITIDESLDRTFTEGADRLCLLGGLSSLYTPWLAEQHRARIIEPKADALTGAVELARLRFTGAA